MANKRPKKNIAVLMGGPSSEYEVSLKTGREILKNLDPRKFSAFPVIVTKNGRWLSSPVKLKTIASTKGSQKTQVEKAVELSMPFAHGNIDCAFIAMHGEFGEDGTLQGLLESAGIPYTGSGILASALGMDKPRSLALFHQAGFIVPEFIVVTKSQWRQKGVAEIRRLKKGFSLPLVIKPADRGSSVGVSIVRERKEIIPAMQRVFTFTTSAMIQRFIGGREITCGVLERRNGTPYALPPTQIIPRANSFYDYRSKYDEGGSTHVTPPRSLAKKQILRVQNAAIRAHRVIGCSGYSRTDFIFSNDGALYVLEINTLPGMTHTSLLPEAAAHSDISFSRLLEMIIHRAHGRRRK